jgi:hypothetical protein
MSGVAPAMVDAFRRVRRHLSGTRLGTGQISYLRVFLDVPRRITRSVSLPFELSWLIPVTIAERKLNQSQQTYSRVPKTAQTAGIVVSSPTATRVAPTAFRRSAVSRSARRSAIPAPSMARVLMVNANSGRLRWVCFTTIGSVRF